MGAQTCKGTKDIQLQSKSGVDKPVGCLQLCKNNISKQKQKNINEGILPIEFSDRGSNRDDNYQKIESEKQIQHKQKSAHPQSNNFLSNQDNSTNYNLKQQTSLMKNIPQNQQLVVIERNDQHIQNMIGDSKFQPISVPFSVIKLMMKTQILKQIKKIDSNFEKKHSDPKNQTFNNWKLQAQGFYSNKISDGTTIMIAQDKFYHGKTQNNFFIPENVGLLITEEGSYKGTFSNGKAHGKGFYVTSNGKIVYDGIWKEGNLQKGKIQLKDQFKYEGDLKNRMPHGRGILIIHKKNVKYNGLFIQGLFEDEQGQYECQNYIYKGKFVQGKKNGYGELHKKERNAKTQGSSKAKNSNILSGNWENDEFKYQMPTNMLRR